MNRRESIKLAIAGFFGTLWGTLPTFGKSKPKKRHCLYHGAAADGDFGNPANWAGGVMPQNGDDVTVTDCNTPLIPIKASSWPDLHIDTLNHIRGDIGFPAFTQ